jgi:pimeloyl-ACP methyl ester carboxylesterase
VAVDASPATADWPKLTRAALAGPGVRVLNLGGLANPDVLRVQIDAERSLVVKDYAPRSFLVRRALVPRLLRHEREVLERLAGLPGIPALGPQLDALAFAMEWIDGQPLRLRSHAHALPPAFFAALRRILDGLAARDVIYTDLRSPSNVLVTRSGAPALVDLSSALCLRAPRALVRWFEERALRKLRRRYETSAAAAASAPAPYDGPVQLRHGGRRIRLWDSGPLGDRVPLLFLPDAGLGVELAAELIAAAAARGRRVVALEAASFAGGARTALAGLHPRRVAADLERILDLLRLPRVDLVAHGWSGLPARWLASRPGARVRALLTVGTPADWLEDAFLARWRDACADPRAVLRRLEASIQGHPQASALKKHLRAVRPGALRRAYRAVPVHSLPRLGWEGWRLHGAPEPRCPWLSEGGAGRTSGGAPLPAALWRSGAERELERIASLGRE